MEQRLRLVTLGVRDLAAARAFYVDGLGWEPTLDLAEIVFIQIGHGLLLGAVPDRRPHRRRIRTRRARASLGCAWRRAFQPRPGLTVALDGTVRFVGGP
jgi:catechol 2,3-dioxygenase-like lactoylglutathione lyase family enzyme